ncbi:NEK/NEK10 protein kinase [Thecamonas trahens ATCC 50062]|uniref:non-specific serine/threonine protein kinase n=1 Tax=Thecamonas trahens ATCC 50062 TaxID=461836 RepID=A0A0L0DFV8_THETB|nr:NEK/NEK10 protein kinase [Thecamonas trahens ATCC 50062]KNC51184.1 NEK/NEK10 protein kinase [Thecamonas trahens ATCC 50062]|eukprot:XP_013756385.1 NEK/NEK10 protein kinase [Thecamonas trahens ATCC 50062]
MSSNSTNHSRSATQSSKRVSNLPQEAFLATLVAHLGRSLAATGATLSNSAEATEVVLLEEFPGASPPLPSRKAPGHQADDRRHIHNGGQVVGKKENAFQGQDALPSPTPGDDAITDDDDNSNNDSEFAWSSSARPSPLADAFQLIFSALFHERLKRSAWCASASRDYRLTVLQVLRLLLRDPRFTRAFVADDGIAVLGTRLAEIFPEYHADAGAPFLAETVVQMASILKNLASDPELRKLLIDAHVHTTCVLLLDAPDAVAVQCVLIVLINLALTPEYALLIGRLDSINKLLNIVHNYNLPAQLLAADLLDVLSKQRENCISIVEAQGLTVLLSLLTADDVALLESLVIILGTLAEDPHICSEIRQMGGLSMLLSLINPGRVYPGAIDGPTSAKSPVLIPLFVAVANTLTTMALEDEAAHQLRVHNGVYYLGLILVDEAWLGPLDGPRPPPGSDVYVMHAYIFQSLRYLFSIERNRKVFKRFFPSVLFAPFVDVGAYQAQLDPYFALVDVYYSLPASEYVTLRANLEAINTNKPPSRYVNGYAILELLGTGSFGSVYLVKKKDGYSTFAMKELDVTASMAGRTSSPEDAAFATQAGAVDELEEEVSILSQLRHPNIVRYYDSFREGGFLYIIMELCEGATLLEYLESLREKGRSMPEKRIWQIFIQLVLAFKYLHKTAKVVHRDLKPSNIMVDAKNVIKLADFGLARHHNNTMMKSVKGTPGYFCPEIMKGEPYNHKADTWALGCVLFQMATLRPPFEGSNILAIGHKIIGGVFDRDALTSHSPLMMHLVTKLIEPNVSRRLDIIQVSQVIAPLLVDQLSKVTYRFQRLERDKKDVERQLKELQRNLHKTKHQLGPGTAPHPHSPASAGSALSPHSPIVPATRSTSGEETVGTPSQSQLPVSSRSGRTPLRGNSLVTPSGGLGTGLNLSTLSISPSRVRAIDDPITQMLNQLHKLVYITQLPPTANRDPRRTIVEKYKRALFAKPDNSLKAEMQKLLTGSTEEIKLDFGMDWTTPMLRRDSVAGAVSDDDSDNGRQAEPAPSLSVTYQELQDMIEKILMETGFHSPE